MISVKQKCSYCGSYSEDDSRGNCSACGGERERIDIRFLPLMVGENEIVLNSFISTEELEYFMERLYAFV